MAASNPIGHAPEVLKQPRSGGLEQSGGKGCQGSNAVDMGARAALTVAAGCLLMQAESVLVPGPFTCCTPARYTYQRMAAKMASQAQAGPPAAAEWSQASGRVTTIVDAVPVTRQHDVQALEGLADKLRNPGEALPKKRVVARCWEVASQHPRRLRPSRSLQWRRTAAAAAAAAGHTGARLIQRPASCSLTGTGSVLQLPSAWLLAVVSLTLSQWQSSARRRVSAPQPPLLPPLCRPAARQHHVRRRAPQRHLPAAQQHDRHAAGKRCAAPAEVLQQLQP